MTIQSKQSIVGKYKMLDYIIEATDEIPEKENSRYVGIQ